MKNRCRGLLFLLVVISAGVRAEDVATVRIGVDPNYPPYESKATDGSLVGFDIDLGNAICKDAGIRCVWVEQSFDDIIPALKAKKFDVILSAMAATEARRKEIDFSNTLYKTPTAMIAATASGLTPTADSLRGKRVGVTRGTAQETYAKSEWSSRGVEVVSYQTDSQLYDALASGRIDAAIQDKAQAEYTFLKKPEGQKFSFVGTDLNDDRVKGDGVAIGIRKGDTELKERLDKGITEIRANGVYGTISKKYFDFDISGG